MQDADINTTNGTTYGSGTGNAHGVTALNSAACTNTSWRRAR